MLSTSLLHQIHSIITLIEQVYDGLDEILSEIETMETEAYSQNSTETYSDMETEEDLSATQELSAGQDDEILPESVHLGYCDCSAHKP